MLLAICNSSWNRLINCNIADFLLFPNVSVNIYLCLSYAFVHWVFVDIRPPHQSNAFVRRRVALWHGVRAGIDQGRIGADISRVDKGRLHTHPFAEFRVVGLRVGVLWFSG